MKLVKCIAAAFLLFALPAAGRAEGVRPEAFVRLEPVTVTARGYAAPQSNTPGGTGVLTEEQLTLSPQSSLADSLANIPGISKSGHSPWGQDISIRGLSGTSVVVLINGKRIHTATDLNARLGFINPADVERVEVLKGPISALYGSGSIGGVVNIITRKPDFTEEIELHGRLALSGSSNPWGTSIYNNYSMSGPKAWAFVSAAGRDYNDVHGGNNDKVEHSAFRDKQLRAMLALKPWDKLSLSLESMRSSGEDIGIPGGVSSMPAIAHIRYPSVSFNYTGADAVLDVDGKVLKKLEASLYYTENRRHVFIDEIEGMAQVFEKPMLSPTGQPYARITFTPLDITAKAINKTLGGKIQATMETESHTLVAGLDAWRWRLDSERTRNVHVRAARITTNATLRELYRSLVDKPSPKAEQRSLGIFLEDDWNINETLSLNIGGRIDYLRTRADAMDILDPARVINSYPTMFQLLPVMLSGGFPFEELHGRTSKHEWGGNVHAGLTWKMNDNWTQSLLLASNYRAADLLERYKFLTLGNNVTVYGNPDLKPERSYYAEYGLSYDNSRVKAELRLFGNVITNYIQERWQDANSRVMDNVDNASIYGAELDARWNINANWSVFGNIAALYGRNHELNEPLADIAPVTAKLGVDFTHASGFWARLDSDLIAAQHRTPAGVEGSSGVVLLNASLGYSFDTMRLKHSVALSVNNIFDKRYYNYLSKQRGSTVWEPGISGMLSYTVEF